MVFDFIMGLEPISPPLINRRVSLPLDDMKLPKNYLLIAIANFLLISDCCQNFAGEWESKPHLLTPRQANCHYSTAIAFINTFFPLFYSLYVLVFKSTITKPLKYPLNERPTQVCNLLLDFSLYSLLDSNQRPTD